MKTTSADPALLVGLDAPDDAAVYRVAPDVAIVQTVDFFTPIVDDPYAWGRIAAANALSDVYAMGAAPITALNLIGWPRSMDMSILGRVLDGAGDTCDEAGVAIVGGHSVDDPEPKYGLAVTGTVHPDRLVRKTGASPGCELVLTKPLGMGIISSGIKEGKTSAPTVARAVELMSALNRGACEAMLEVGVEAATDVTGYGLIGHLLGMLDGRVSARLVVDDIPVLDEALELVRAGVLAGGSRRNYENMRSMVHAGTLEIERQLVLYDAQTSGGLLIAVQAQRTQQLQEALRRAGASVAARIGAVVEGPGRIALD